MISSPSSSTVTQFMVFSMTQCYAQLQHWHLGAWLWSLFEINSYNRICMFWGFGLPSIYSSCSPWGWLTVRLSKPTASGTPPASLSPLQASDFCLPQLPTSTGGIWSTYCHFVSQATSAEAQGPAREQDALKFDFLRRGHGWMGHEQKQLQDSLWQFMTLGFVVSFLFKNKILRISFWMCCILRIKFSVWLTQCALVSHVLTEHILCPWGVLASSNLASQER